MPKNLVWLFDGNGTTYLAQIEEIRDKKTKLLVLEKRQQERPKTRIILGQALIRFQKMDFIVQKATELGIAAILPLITARSLIRLEEFQEKKVLRWKKIALEAAKQCRSAFAPEIFAPQELKQIIRERKEEKKIFLSERQGMYLRQILLASFQSGNIPQPMSAIIVVGPEGGWTDEEEASLASHGFEAVSLGKNILRAESASLCAMAMISHFWNW